MISEIKEFIDNPEAVFFCNHSGGKDSQAMYLYLKNIIPAERLIVVHAHLPEVEWPGTEDFIRSTIEHELEVCQAQKTFFDMVEKRQMFPSPSYRQCTSDLKRDPIAKVIRRITKERGFSIVVNCLGLRSEESPGRAKKSPLQFKKRFSTKTRDWFEWLPVKEWSTEHIFKYIEMNGQEPFWTYAEGLSRKSCSFCIMSSAEDLCISARLRPELLERYDQYEKSTGQVMMMPSKSKGKRTIKQIISDHESRI